MGVRGELERERVGQNGESRRGLQGDATNPNVVAVIVRQHDSLFGLLCIFHRIFVQDIEENADAMGRTTDGREA